MFESTLVGSKGEKLLFRFLFSRTLARTYTRVGWDAWILPACIYPTKSILCGCVFFAWGSADVVIMLVVRPGRWTNCCRVFRAVDKVALELLWSTLFSRFFAVFSIVRRCLQVQLCVSSAQQFTPLFEHMWSTDRPIDPK